MTTTYLNEVDLPTFLGLGDGNAGFSGIQATVHIEADADEEAIEACIAKWSPPPRSDTP